MVIPLYPLLEMLGSSTGEPVKK